MRAKKITRFLMDENARARIMAYKNKHRGELATDKVRLRYCPPQTRNDVYCRLCGGAFAHMEAAISKRSSRCVTKHYHEKCARIVNLID